MNKLTAIFLICAILMLLAVQSFAAGADRVFRTNADWGKVNIEIMPEAMNHLDFKSVDVGMKYKDDQILKLTVGTHSEMPESRIGNFRVEAFYVKYDGTKIPIPCYADGDNKNPKFEDTFGWIDFDTEILMYTHARGEANLFRIYWAPEKKYQ